MIINKKLKVDFAKLFLGIVNLVKSSKIILRLTIKLGVVLLVNVLLATRSVIIFNPFLIKREK